MGCVRGTEFVDAFVEPDELLVLILRELAEPRFDGGRERLALLLVGAADRFDLAGDAAVVARQLLLDGLEQPGCRVITRGPSGGSGGVHAGSIGKTVSFLRQL